ncbi:MAG: ABC transporter substrate-binding protein [Clostridiaceae bacterium]|nr:ABC transporter substrate-binding protein [Clostridiaceae bacterium]
MKKRIVAIITLLMMSMFFLVACNEAGEASSNEELTKVVVAELRSEFWMPAYLAETLGYYEEEGLEVEFVTTKDGPVAFQAMHAGSSDFTMLSTEPVFRAQTTAGLESKIILSTLTNKPYMLIGAPEITDISQLKGETIFAGMPGSAPHSFAIAILEKNGMKESDVQWAQMEYGASLGALENGHIAASYLRSTAKNEAAEIGANILVDVSDANQHQEIYGTSRYESSIITATKEFVEENPETVQQFTNAIVRAMIWMDENSDADVAAKATPLFGGRAVTAEQISYLRPSVSKDGFITEEGHETIVEFCLEEGIINRYIPYDEVYDMSFIEKALEKYNK